MLLKIKLPWSIVEVKNEEQDQEGLEAPEEEIEDVFTIEGREGLFTRPRSTYEKYAMRPTEPQVVDLMCPAEFFISYTLCGKNEDVEKHFEEGLHYSSTNDGSLKGYARNLYEFIQGENEFLPKYIKLDDGTNMRLRNTRVILQMQLSKNKKSLHEQIYSELLAFTCWRNEESLHFDDYQECRDYFFIMEDMIEINKKQIFPFSKTLELLREMVEQEDIERPAHLIDTIDAAGEQENQECEDEMPPLDDSRLPEEQEDQSNRPQTEIREETCQMRPISIDELEIMTADARNLSFEQKVVFNELIDYCIRLKMAKEGKCEYPTPPRFIVTGEIISR